MYACMHVCIHSSRVVSYLNEPSCLTEIQVCASGYIKSFKSRFLKITEIWLSNSVIFDGAWGLLSDPDRLFVSAVYKVGSNTRYIGGKDIRTEWRIRTRCSLSKSFTDFAFLFFLPFRRTLQF